MVRRTNEWGERGKVRWGKAARNVGKEIAKRKWKEKKIQVNTG